MTTVKELRMKTGLSQSKFAAKYHLQTTTLQHWEQGVARTPESILYLLERVISFDLKDASSHASSS